MFRTAQYFRLTNEEECHCGFQYKDGLNVDTNKFHPYGKCQQGGLYFFSREEIWKYPSYIGGADKVHWVREVTLPDDAKVHLEDGKRKADRFVLGPRRRFNPYTFFSDNFTYDEKLEVVKQNGYSIHYFVDSATDEMKLEAVKQDGNSICYFVDSATDEMKLEAVKQDGYSIQWFVDSATDEMKLEAVKKNVYCIRWFVGSATDEMKWEALKQNGYSIQWFVNSATEEMKKIAEAMLNK